MHNLHALALVAHPYTLPYLFITLSPAESLLAASLRISPGYRNVKRWLDICLSMLLVLCCLSLFPLFLLIIWSCNCPILFQQLRIGWQGQLFTIYKLRTMVVHAEHHLQSHPVLSQHWHAWGKLHNDPRVTDTGRWLRRYSLDELPQIFNVFRGDMSLIGPRPIQPSELSQFGVLSTLRHSVKPGLTGLWQVQGRSLLSYEQRCILDCFYVMKCSFWQDFTLLLQTVSVVFCGKGAS